MLTLKPKISIRPLQQSDSGSVVLVDGAPAIVTVAAEDPQRRHTLAVLDVAQHAFVYRLYQGEEVATLAGAVTFEPDVSSLSAAPTMPDFKSGADVFLAGDALFTVVRINTTSDWRLVDLRDGSIVKWRGQHMPALKHWRLGITTDPMRTDWLIQA